MLYWWVGGIDHGSSMYDMSLSRMLDMTANSGEQMRFDACGVLCWNSRRNVRFLSGMMLGGRLRFVFRTSRIGQRMAINAVVACDVEVLCAGEERSGT